MERPVIFTEGQETLQGILHEPETSAPGPVVVFLHGWAGSRIGPPRMFGHMARRLAAGGCPCLRFDFRGRGDSEGASAGASIRSMIADAKAAVDCAVQRYPGRDVALLGICSGGKVAVGAAVADPRVNHLALWSAEPMGAMRDRASLKRKSVAALRSYGRKLLRAETWRKLITFRVNMKMVGKAVASREVAGHSEIEDEKRWLKSFLSYKGRALFIYGSNDPETVAAKAGYLPLCRQAGIPHACHDVAGANHSFYSLAWEREVLNTTEAWLTACNGTSSFVFGAERGSVPAGIVTDSAPKCVRT
jgi:pimeloyl-ACP methyl ester carboxylesterase